MKQFFTFLVALLLTTTTFAQVGINNDSPDASSALDITSTSGGVLIPRMTKTQRDAISSPGTGLMIYQTDNTADFYYFNGSSWSQVGSTSKTYTVNTFYAELGGYVIEVNSDGTHGIVVAMQDNGNQNWNNAFNYVNNPSYHDTDGASFKDWQLPTKRELELIYQVFLNGNGANLNSSVEYWSSIAKQTSRGWKMDFSNGTWSYSTNWDESEAIRAVRYF